MKLERSEQFNFVLFIDLFMDGFIAWEMMGLMFYHGLLNVCYKKI